MQSSIRALKIAGNRFLKTAKVKENQKTRHAKKYKLKASLLKKKHKKSKSAQKYLERITKQQ